MRQASRSSACILEPPAPAAPAVADAHDQAHAPTEPDLVRYDVLILAGEPQRHLCTLPSGIEAGSEVVVAGETWTVADVREPKDSGPVTLICIYAS